MIHTVPHGPTSGFNLIPLDFHSWGFLVYHSYYVTKATKTCLPDCRTVIKVTYICFPSQLSILFFIFSVLCPPLSVKLVLPTLDSESVWTEDPILQSIWPTLNIAWLIMAVLGLICNFRHNITILGHSQCLWHVMTFHDNSQKLINEFMTTYENCEHSWRFLKIH